MGGGTVLVSPFADQAALRGFLDQLWNLNFTVISIEKVGNAFETYPIDIRCEDNVKRAKGERNERRNNRI
jgi:hypothetical protein